MFQFIRLNVCISFCLYFCWKWTQFTINVLIVIYLFLLWFVTVCLFVCLSICMRINLVFLLSVNISFFCLCVLPLPWDLSGSEFETTRTGSARTRHQPFPTRSAKWVLADKKEETSKWPKTLEKIWVFEKLYKTSESRDSLKQLLRLNLHL